MKLIVVFLKVKVYQNNNKKKPLAKFKKIKEDSRKKKKGRIQIIRKQRSKESQSGKYALLHLNFYFYFMCIGVWSTYMSVHHMHALPTEARRWHLLQNFSRAIVAR